jgi:murein DD-endopeptidase MepM/ murein hydrolase activator NlpD
VVSFAGYNRGGYGYLVIVRHRLGYETWYAHLSAVTSYVGERVVGGTRVGLVGSTGNSTGPHLHFEVRLRGTPIDPMPRLLATAASASAFPQPSTDPSAEASCDRQRLRAKEPAGRARWPSSVC